MEDTEKRERYERDETEETELEETELNETEPEETGMKEPALYDRREQERLYIRQERMHRRRLRRKKLLSGAGRLLVGFAIVIIVCTYLSRFANASLIPVVECKKAGGGTITHTIKTSGTVKETKKIPVYVPSGFRIDSISVEEGSSVKEGDVLLTFDLEQIREKDEEKRLELNSLYKQRKEAIKEKLSVVEIDRQISEVSREKYQYTSLISLEGNVLAKQNMQITDVNVSLGSSSGEDAAFLGSPLSGKYNLMAQVSEEDAAFIQKGDQGMVQTAAAEEGEYFEVKSVSQDQENPFAYNVRMRVPAKKYKIGASVNVTFTRTSEQYDYCVPWSAVRTNAMGTNYILVTRSKDTLLGESITAQMVEVTIQEYNDTDCAVSGSSLSKDMNIIINSDKQVEAGDVVRLKEN